MTNDIRRMIGEYEESLRKVDARRKELRAVLKQRGHDPDLDRRIDLLYTERRELMGTIGLLKSYLKAWGEES